MYGKHWPDAQTNYLSFALFFPQVRLAASWATRSFLVTLGDNEAKEQFYPKLLPPMCLNRSDELLLYNPDQACWRT